MTLTRTLQPRRPGAGARRGGTDRYGSAPVQAARSRAGGGLVLLDADGGYVRPLGREPLSGGIAGELHPGAAIDTSVTFTPLETDPAEGWIAGVIDPEQLVFFTIPGSPGPADPACSGGLREALESDLTDNVVRIPYRVQPRIDLEVVSVTAAPTVEWALGGSYRVTWTLRNNSAVPVENVRRRLTVRTRLGDEGIRSGVAAARLGPGETKDEEELITLGPCGTHVATVEVNPQRNPPEETWDNNLKSAATLAGGARCAGGGMGSFRRGEGRVIIVPNDCLPAGLTDRRPCTNYPLEYP